MSNQNFFSHTRKQLEETAKALKLKPLVVKNLKKPDKLIKFKIPVLMDNGRIKSFTGFRCQHNNVLGP